jgi:hypothetical protein
VTMSFDSKYHPDDQAGLQPQNMSSILHLEAGSPGIVDFLSRHAGWSFNQSLYRIHAVGDMPKWTATVIDAFPDFRERVLCFSCDWLGRHFAIDFGRHEQSQCLLLMFEPGTGQALEIPATFRDFHNVELVEYQNEALAADFYRAWLAASGAVPDLTQCIGYKKPLFLSGADDVSNLELTDMDVYWSLCGQLLAKTRDLPEGTKIGDLRIS